MAVTITGYPSSTYPPAYNPIVFSVNSTSYLQTNFKFIADIYLNNSATPLPRQKYPAIPGQNYQAIDIGGIVKNYVSRNPFIITENKFKTDDNSIVKITVQFGEEYGPSSGVTSYPNLTASSTYYGVNACLPYTNFITDSLLTLPTSFLTNAPRINSVVTQNIGVDEDSWLYFINSAPNVLRRLQIGAFDVSGNILNICEFSNPSSGVTSTEMRHLRVGVGTSELNSLTNADLITGTIPVLPANTSYYSVVLNNGTGASTSEVATFYIKTKCSKASTNYRMVWLNTKGGYDSFTFYGQNQRTSAIERKMYKKYAGYFNSGAFTFDNQNSRQNAQYNTVIKDTYKVTSDWITEAESTWLEELIASPDIYYVGDSDLIPVNITDNNYTFKTTSRDQLFNLEINFQPCFERMRQQW